ncbi:hypothetical protein NEOLEDRAFT_936712 [Neolentinus lepideus HHB14362 ss-1]|uniref:Uncharacterized protein n=1 Tax=Neolentinus lepideus HHB14362 ss-1 TaxID=1314782 RepID=A0A165NJ26_9AGAM|nr:hypothetical protein NEOLEDRAFT_936712 [Neolentinus lepideus HHB14362 ss-1]
MDTIVVISGHKAGPLLTYRPHTHHSPPILHMGHRPFSIRSSGRQSTCILSGTVLIPAIPPPAKPYETQKAGPESVVPVPLHHLIERSSSHSCPRALCCGPKLSRYIAADGNSDASRMLLASVRPGYVDAGATNGASLGSSDLAMVVSGFGKGGSITWNPASGCGLGWL